MIWGIVVIPGIDTELSLRRPFDLTQGTLRVIGKTGGHFPGVFCSLFDHLRFDLVEAVEEVFRLIAGYP